ncbi:ROK family transcriptional regulator [Micromonospora yasonensis]|uniref:ROK family transcriptional regulator n=1 Tax=Micromonospora yasonensis TaxID=1128667 RepID=UPI00223049AD|nr:ROK family transcriptional regulator [Micromonospora yasonensis]MCW3839585.1 ROK family transcriptional regulator [Micromonospora yasonensis]
MRPKAGDPSLLRRLNSAAVLHTLYTGGPLTLTELARSTGLSRPTCEEAANELVGQGWVTDFIPEPRDPRPPGRPARRLTFRADAGRVLGIDIGAHKILALVADLHGTILARHRATVDPDMPAPRRLRKVNDILTACVPALDGAALLATVAASPGVISGDGHVLASVLPDWTGLDLRAQIEHQVTTATGGTLSGPVAVENDMKLAALAEHWCGAATDARDVIYVHAGHRIGAGILIDGKPHRGHHGASGEIGTLKLLDWENSYHRLLSHQSTVMTEVEDGIHAVFDAVRDGDSAAAKRVDRFALDLAQGVAAMALTVDPDLVVVGGGISQAGPLIVDPVRRYLDELCLFSPQVRASSLGSEAVALGAVRSALHHVEQRLFQTDAA